VGGGGEGRVRRENKESKQQFSRGKLKKAVGGGKGRGISRKKKRLEGPCVFSTGGWKKKVTPA